MERKCLNCFKNISHKRKEVSYCNWECYVKYVSKNKIQYKSEGICKKCDKYYMYLLKNKPTYIRKFCKTCVHSRKHSDSNKESIRAGVILAWKNGKFDNIDRKALLIKQKKTWKKKSLQNMVNWICPVCSTVKVVTKARAKKIQYCSGTCRNKVNNRLITGSVSKSEKLLRKILKDNGYKLKVNNRKILDGLEIDIWIPSINTGIEYNGIYHYKAIHGIKSLNKIQFKDRLKIIRAKKKGIILIQIKDVQCTKDSVENIGNKLLKKLIKIEHSVNRKPLASRARTPRAGLGCSAK